MNTLTIKRYNPSMEGEWNRIVSESRNGTFLIDRKYLDYHSDRFSDHSLVIEMNGDIIAVFPANEKGKNIYSHQGLTYGGLIMTSRCKGAVVVEIFDKIVEYYRGLGYEELTYKPIPHIYHTRPSEEDIYALCRHNAQITSCGISSTINLSEEILFSSLRSRGVKKAIANGVEIKEETDFSKFWQILTSNLESRHSVSPVHSLSEITLLKSRFPENIRLYTATKESEILAGVVIYESAKCIHTQYIASSQEGRNLSALDMLFSYLIKEQYREYKYFDFGISTEEGGAILNNGLLSQKEGFGASGVVYNSYKIKL